MEFSKRKLIARELPDNPPPEYLEYIHEILKDALLIFSKSIKKKYFSLDIPLYRIYNDLYFKTLMENLKSKTALYLFEAIEDESNFKNYLFGILKNVRLNYFQYYKANEVDMVILEIIKFSNPSIFKEEKEKKGKKEKPKIRIDDIQETFSSLSKEQEEESISQKILERIKISDTIKCIKNTVSDIRNEKMKSVLFLILDGFDNIEIIFIISFLTGENLNRGTLYSYKSRGYQILYQNCINTFMKGGQND